MMQKITDYTATLFIDSAEGLPSGCQEQDRVRRAYMRGLLPLLMAAILFGGCAAYTPEPLPPNHPASPAAPETPLPPPSQAFSSENLLPVQTEEASVQDPHVGHGAMHGGHR